MSTFTTTPTSPLTPLGNPGGLFQPAPGASAAGVGLGSPSQDDAMAIIQNLLGQYGLGSLASWAWGLITQGLDANAVQLQLFQRPEFLQRFPAIAARQKAGLPPISPGDYVSYENQVQQLGRAAGLPKGFMDSYVTGWLSNDTSVAEVGQRVQDATQAMYQVPAEVRQQLQSYYGVPAGHLAAFFLDPAKAEPLIHQQFQAAQIGGQAAISGYTGLAKSDAERLAAQGVTQAQAQTGFQHLGLESQLFNQLPGQQGPTIGTQTQLGAEFLGDAADQRAIQQEALRRQAVFQGGGGFAANSRGMSGVGTEQGAQAG